MEQQIASSLRKNLDNRVFSMVGMIKQDIYNGIIVPTVEDWFGGSDSILTLNNNIKKNVEEAWQFLEIKIKAQLSEFEEQTKSTLTDSADSIGSDFDVGTVTDELSRSISNVIGTLSTFIIMIISGGSGTALIASGPVGWVIGGVIGAFAFFLGKDAIKGMVSDFIVDKKIPAFIKKRAKAKAFAQLKLNESKFEREVFNMLRQQLQPVYDVIDRELSK